MGPSRSFKAHEEDGKLELCRRPATRQGPRSMIRNYGGEKSRPCHPMFINLMHSCMKSISISGNVIHALVSFTSRRSPQSW